MLKHAGLRAEGVWLGSFALCAALVAVSSCGDDNSDPLTEAQPVEARPDGATETDPADEDSGPDETDEPDAARNETSDAAQRDAADANIQLDAADADAQLDAADADAQLDAADADAQSDAADADAQLDAAGAPPTLNLVGASELVLDCGATFVEPGFAATDELGQTLSVEVVGGGVVNTAAPGTTTIRYRATSATGVSTERTRVVHVCGPACGQLGKQAIDLSNWQSIQYEQNYQADALWTLATDHLSVVQSVNADASIFLSDFDATDFAVEGRWRMGSSSDDDFVGFIFGYRDRGHFYLFDWKQGSQTFFGGLAQAGMTLKIVNAATPDTGVDALQLSSADLWYSAGTPNVTIMQKDGVPLQNTIPWVENVDYFFFLEFHAGRFRIDVRDAAGVTLASWSVSDSTYTAGAFGFYNFSQGPVTYQSFTRRVTPVACSTVK